MNTLIITQGAQAGKTFVSNHFIDHYMSNANDAQIKIYLYLLRAAGTSLPSGISDIADRFNHTEHDVMRALKYWDKLKVISLVYDDNKTLTGITLEDLDEAKVSSSSTITIHPSANTSKDSSFEDSDSAVPESNILNNTESINMADPFSLESPEFDKNSVSLDQLRDFKNREETPQLIFIVEQYLGKTLSSSDIRSIYFMTDILHFNSDLVDYLIQYCVGRNVKDFHYIEKVARSWADSKITTPKQAASFCHKYDKNVYSIMRELGKNTDPAPKELMYIYRWIKEYTFSLDMILEACGKTVLATDKHRFEYADGILSKWYKDGVHSLSEIPTVTNRPKKAPSDKAASNNQFNQFTQNQYDYDDLLNKIKVN